MGQKLCTGRSDTPLVTFDCTIISVTRSPNVNIDVTDSPVSEDEEESEKILNIVGVVAYYGDDVDGRAKTKKGKRKEKLQFPVIHST